MGERHSCTKKVADKYPQKSYAAVSHVVQSEWIFLQRVMKDTGKAFTGMEKGLQKTFFPSLFFGK